MATSREDRKRYEIVDKSASWEYTRTVDDITVGRPVGLFKLDLPSQLEGGKSAPKEYVVNILPMDAAKEWCDGAREIIDRGSAVSVDLNLKNAPEIIWIAEARDRVKELEGAEQTKLNAKILERSTALNMETEEVSNRELQTYAEDMVEHLFEYGPLKDLREEIMSAKPQLAMLVASFMRLFRFTDPINALRTIAEEMTRTV